MLMGVLAVLVAAVAAFCLRDRIQIRRRRSHVRQALESENPARRATALRDLNQWSPREIGSVRDMLLEAVHDASSSVAQQAIHLLRAAFPAEPLVSQLERGTARGRAEAAALLVVHNPDVVAEPLLRAALSGPAPGRAAASDALAKLAQSATLPPLVRALVEDDEDAGALAAQVFRAAGSRGAQPLKAALDDTDELIRCGAIEALLLVASEGSARAISSRLSDPVPQVRTRAARALGLLQANSSFREPLLAALEDSSPAVQQAAALSLARMGGEDLSELLTALDRRISEQPDLPVADVLVEAIASRCASPSAALASATSSLNRGFAAGLLQALERAGRLDEWMQQFARAEPQERELMLSVLRAAAAGGVSGPLLRGLELPEPKAQEASALLLGEAKEREAIQPLSHLLSVSHESVRIAAARALGQIGGSDAAAVLLPALADPAAAVRTAATYAFGQSLAPAETGDEPAAEGDAGRTAASAALTKALRDPAAEVRSAAANGLGVLKADEAVPALIDLALRDQEPSARTAAVVALGEMRAQEVLPLLMDVVNDPDSGLRCRAIEIFGSAGDPMVAEVLVNALHDEDVNVRETAGRALWDIATRGHVETLVPYLKSPDPKVRSAIAGIIGKSEAAEHAASLAEAAADPDPFVRASIINAFHSLGEAAADYVPLLIERLADPDAFVRARAAEALIAMAPTSEQAAREMLPLVSDPDPSVREAVAGSLLGFAERGMYGPLLELLGDPSRRPEALQLLHGADETKLRALLQTAQEAPTDVRRAAMETLSYLLSKRWTAKDFRQELDSLDPKVRVAGLEGLALVASPEAVRTVARVLAADPSGEIRTRAAEILSQWDDPVAQEALRNAAETDPDSRVRDAALLRAEHSSAAS
jgi:HEAT repeat protein